MKWSKCRSKTRTTRTKNGEKRRWRRQANGRLKWVEIRREDEEKRWEEAS